MNRGRARGRPPRRSPGPLRPRPRLACPRARTRLARNANGAPTMPSPSTWPPPAPMAFGAAPGNSQAPMSSRCGHSSLISSVFIAASTTRHEQTRQGYPQTERAWKSNWSARTARRRLHLAGQGIAHDLLRLGDDGHIVEAAPGTDDCCIRFSNSAATESTETDSKTATAKMCRAKLSSVTYHPLR